MSLRYSFFSFEWDICAQVPGRTTLPLPIEGLGSAWGPDRVEGWQWWSLQVRSLPLFSFCIVQCWPSCCLLRALLIFFGEREREEAECLFTAFRLEGCVPIGKAAVSLRDCVGHGLCFGRQFSLFFFFYMCLAFVCVAVSFRRSLFGSLSELLGEVWLSRGAGPGAYDVRGGDRGPQYSMGVRTGGSAGAGETPGQRGEWARVFFCPSFWRTVRRKGMCGCGFAFSDVM